MIYNAFHLEFKTTKYFCKTNFDMEKIKQEESYYVDLPKIYAFSSEREKEVMLNRNFKRVNDEVKAMINELLGKASDEWGLWYSHVYLISL